ncbi:hypothetical protein MN608_10297 [Microdochium nivale]|nr:hypothetical protein MN608_10297 [Microdochium nivale]
MFGYRLVSFVGLAGLMLAQCSLAKDQAHWAEQIQDTTFVSVVRSTTKIIKLQAGHVTTRHPSPKTTPHNHGGGGGGAQPPSFTTIPLFSTETYEVEECQFDNDDPGFSKCQTATTVVTYVRGISTSWHSDEATVTDEWPTPWEPSTTRTHDYPYPPASSGPPPWQTTLDLCDVFSATWCQSTSQSGSESASDSYSHTHSFTHSVPPDPCLTTSHWWCPTSTTQSTHGTPTGTILPIPLTSVCVSHNLTTTCFIPPATSMAGANSTSFPNSTASSWSSPTAGAGNGTASIHVNATSLILPTPFPGTVVPTPKPLYTNSSASWTELSTPTLGQGTVSAITPASSINYTSSTVATELSTKSLSTMISASHPRHASSQHMSPATWLPSRQPPAPTTRILGGGAGSSGGGGVHGQGHAQDDLTI